MGDKQAPSRARSPKSASPPAGPADTSTGAPLATESVHGNVEILPPDHWAQLGLIEDDDSAIGSDPESSTASLSSSILRYRTLHGRTYHSELGDAQYWGTVDSKHLNSMDLNHHIFTLTLDDKLYLAPVKNPKRVLDIGTGTGIWAIDFADAHPDSTVIATDIAPIQPTWTPPNVQFEIDDCTSPWTFVEGSFDYIHIRYLVGCIRDWDALFAEAYKSLAPGGYIESHEISLNIQSDDGTLPPNSPISQWGPVFSKGGEITGRTFRVIEDDIQIKSIEAAGFVEPVIHNYKSPSGFWPSDPRQKEIGMLNEVLGTSDLEGFVMFMTNVLGWTAEEVSQLTAHIRRQVRVEKPHIYYPMRVVYARKPNRDEDQNSPEAV